MAKGPPHSLSEGPPSQGATLGNGSLSLLLEGVRCIWPRPQSTPGRCNRLRRHRTNLPSGWPLMHKCTPCHLSSLGCYSAPSQQPIQYFQLYLSKSKCITFPFTPDRLTVKCTYLHCPSLSSLLSTHLTTTTLVEASWPHLCPGLDS